jgi:hypothetical protein
MTNNTTSEGWLKKANFIEDREDPIQASFASKWLASTPPTTYRVGFGNIANGSAAWRIWSQMPSIRMTTALMKN